MEARCVVPQKYKNELTFEPESARLRPKEIIDVICTFTPSNMEPFIMEIPIYYSNVTDWTNDLIGFYNPGSGKKYKQKENKGNTFTKCI